MNIAGQMMRVLNRLLFCCHKMAARIFNEQGKILMFHHVGASDKYSPYNITVSSFSRLIDEIKMKKVVSVGEIKESKSFVALTFDDVPEDFYKNAYPLLNKNHIPFTLFISSSLLDTSGYLSTHELIEIANNPLATIGSHGVNHKRFWGISSKELNYEFSFSKEELERIIGKKVKYFAFPYGSYTSCGLRHKHDLLKYYEYGFSTIPVALNFSSWWQPYFLPRINVEENNISKILK